MPGKSTLTLQTSICTNLPSFCQEACWILAKSGLPGRLWGSGHGFWLLWTMGTPAWLDPLCPVVHAASRRKSPPLCRILLRGPAHDPDVAIVLCPPWSSQTHGYSSTCLWALGGLPLASAQTVLGSGPSAHSIRKGGEEIDIWLSSCPPSPSPCKSIFPSSTTCSRTAARGIYTDARLLCNFVGAYLRPGSVLHFFPAHPSSTLVEMALPLRPGGPVQPGPVSHGI